MTADQVRQRFDQALQSGEPRWLWPEVTVHDWRATVDTIRQLSTDVLLRGHSTVLLEGDPIVISVAAFTSGMGPLLGYWLREQRFPASADAATVLAHHLDHNESRMRKMADQAVEVVEHLACHGIGSTVLKGMHTAFAYFPHPATRPMTDIDILIGPADEGGAAIALRELGFSHSGKPAFPERTWRRPELPITPKNLFFLHQDDQWSIDLHVTLNLIPTSAAPPIGLNSLLTRTSASWALSPAGRCLDHPALPIHLAVHTGIHLISSSLLRLTELALVLRKESEQGALSWAELRSAAQHSGAMGALFPAFKLCEQLVPGTIPHAVERDCRQAAPDAVVRIIEGLTPADAQGMLRCSVEERFMWLPSVTTIAKQVAYDLFPLKRNLKEILQIYRMLFWRLFYRTISR